MQFSLLQKNRATKNLTVKLKCVIWFDHKENVTLLHKSDSATYWQFSSVSQVNAWQSATLLPISCTSVQPVPARVEEPVSSVRQSSSGGTRNNPPFPKMPYLLLKLVVYYQCVLRRKRRTRPTKTCKIKLDFWQPDISNLRNQKYREISSA